MSKKEAPERGVGETTVYDAVSRLAYTVAEHTVGKLCTLLDSAIVDERQVKALKDLAKQIVYDASQNFVTYTQAALWHCRDENRPLFPDWLEKRLELRGKYNLFGTS